MIDSGSRKSLPTRSSASGTRELVTVGPTTNRQKGIHMAILLLDLIELFDTAIDVISRIGPRITGEMLADIGIRVSQDHFAGGLDVQKSIENMGEVIRDQIIRHVASGIDSLSSAVSKVPALERIAKRMRIRLKRTQSTKKVMDFRPDPALVWRSVEWATFGRTAAWASQLKERTRPEENRMVVRNDGVAAGLQLGI